MDRGQYAYPDCGFILRSAAPFAALSGLPALSDGLIQPEAGTHASTRERSAED
jgi:hypothetical protein